MKTISTYMGKESWLSIDGWGVIHEISPISNQDTTLELLLKLMFTINYAYIILIGWWKSNSVVASYVSGE